MDDLARRLEEAKSALQDQTIPDETRQRLKEAAKGLLTSLEEPKDIILDYAYQMGAKRMALRVGVDLGIFRSITEQGRRPISSAELAKITKAEESLLTRIMRVLVAMNFVAEVGEYQYLANPITEAMATPAMEGAVKVCHDYSTLVLHRIHDYFREHGYQTPDKSEDCALQWVFNTKKNYFDVIHANEESLRAFNDFMLGNRVNRKHWTDWFPIEEKLLEGFESIPGSQQNEESVFLVDLGGGLGRDVRVILSKFPQTRDKLVLEDLQATADEAEESQNGFRTIGHDFFNPQPIKGARVYFTHFVLHDWPDRDCQKILSRVKEVMTPGYSRIILNESVLPDVGCASYFAAGDLNLMALIGGMKRTREHWKSLIESVGLEVVDIANSPFPADEEGIIEAIRK